MMAFSSAESFTTGLPLEKSMVFSSWIATEGLGTAGEGTAAVEAPPGVVLEALTEGAADGAPGAGFELRRSGCMNQARAAPSAMKPRMNRMAAGFFMGARWREIQAGARSVVGGTKGGSGVGPGWAAAWGSGAEGGSETLPYVGRQSFLSFAWGFT